jgi:hypothetical protein
MQRPRFDLRSAHVAFVLDKSYWDMFHHVPWFPLSIIMSPVLHIHSPIILGWYSKPISNHSITAISYSISRTQNEERPARVCVREGGGTGGVNRYELTWPHSVGLRHNDKLTSIFINTFAPNIRYTSHTVWCSKCQMSGTYDSI